MSFNLIKPAKLREYDFQQAEGMPPNVWFYGDKRHWDAVISRTSREGTPFLGGVKVSTALSPLVRTFASEHPDWLVCTKPAAFAGVADLFSVYAADEEIGMLGYNERKSQFNVSSRSISSKMERRSYKSTGDLGKAYKLAKTIVPKTYAENMSIAVDKAERVMYGLHRDYRGQMESAVDTFVANFRNKVRSMAGMTRCLEIMKEFGCTADELVNFGQGYENDVKITELQNKARATVLIKDGKYIVRIGVGEGTQVYDELPDGLRSSVGMLKLVEIGTFIPDVGCRAEENVFAIKLAE